MHKKQCLFLAQAVLSLGLSVVTSFAANAQANLRDFPGSTTFSARWLLPFKVLAAAWVPRVRRARPTKPSCSSLAERWFRRPMDWPAAVPPPTA